MPQHGIRQNTALQWNMGGRGGGDILSRIGRSMREGGGPHSIKLINLRVDTRYAISRMKAVDG